MGNKTCFSQCFLVFFYLLSFMINFSKSSDTIFPGRSLSGNQTLISAGGIFELGFFTPGNSQSYYIGIWYKAIPDQTVVWVANRIQPVSNPFSSSLKLLEDGNLVLLNSTNSVIWSTNSTHKVINSTTAKLLDDGNFVVRNELDSSSVLWQSFDHPTDNWLSGAKLGYNKLTNEKQTLLSWRSSENPAPGHYALELAQYSIGRLLLWNGSEEYWVSRDLGKNFSPIPPYITNLTLVSNKHESYFTYNSHIPNTLTRFVIEANGQYSQFLWQKNLGEWKLIWKRPSKCCNVFPLCGTFGIYNPQENPLCVCLEGFKPKLQKNWELRDHTDGCVRTLPLNCDGGRKNSFIVIPNIISRDNSESLEVKTIEECELACLSNCSCNAFASDNGCLIWKGDIFNLQFGCDEGIGRNFHLRIATSSQGKTKSKTAWIVCATIAGFFTLFSAILVILYRKLKGSAGLYKAVADSLILFKYKDLKTATKNFSEKLGEGGFGSVFRGALPDLTAIAVKELRCFDQSREKQFSTEVKTIGLIQHINLARLRGICVEASKRLLVYEYMPNGSLDSVLCRKSDRILDWQTRYKIAIGIARGLAYLHEECRDCIIHCDIKPENILLDAEYNPKIADFGLAKLIGRDFSRVLTTMRGTMGYLAPEWFSGEAVTPKADAFSYGMLLLEVISGRRNRDTLEECFDNYFPLQAAMKVYQGENVLGLLDDRLAGNAMIEELSRACKAACWCIQGNEKDRPTMGEVVKILEGVSEVGIPPIPCFLQHILGNSSHPV